jgi:S1-C subfamily serine protease
MLASIDGEGVMPRVRFAFVILCCAVFLGPPASARGPYGKIHVGSWSGGAYVHNDTGEFTNCIASASYKSGIILTVAVSKSYNWMLGFSNPAWTLKQDATFPIVLTFDGRPPFNVVGKVLSAGLVGVPMPDNSALIAQFRQAHAMSAFAEGQLFQFEMKGTSLLLLSLVNCVKSVNETGLANAGDFSIAPQPKQAAQPVVASTPAPAPSQDKNEKLFDQTGTGFVVSTSGHVVTNQHVIVGCVGDIKGNLTGEAPSTLRLVSTDETNDLALLQAPSPFKEVGAIRNTPIHSGDSVIAIGYPYHGLLTSDFTVTTGIISSLSGLLNDSRYLQISAAVQPGNSGGPLLDNAGEIVGVVAAKINALKFAKATGDLPENINFAIKTGALRDFLDNSAVAYQTVDRKAELKTADIVQSARAFTLLISCKAKDTGAATAKAN